MGKATTTAVTYEAEAIRNAREYAGDAARRVKELEGRVAELEAQLVALQRDASQETSADDLVKRLVVQLRYLGDRAAFEPHMFHDAADRIEAQAARIAELERAIIQCRTLSSMLKPQADRIAELEVALKAAAEDIGDWGAYASQYFQEKWDLEGDVKRYIAIAEGKLPYRARHPMETWKDE